MSEILVRIKDKNDHPLSSKRGDVIAVCPDGWNWSERERTNPEWRIIKTPILKTMEAALLKTDIDNKTGELIKKRAYKIDLDIITKSEEFSPEEKTITDNSVIISSTDLTAVTKLKTDIITEVSK